MTSLVFYTHRDLIVQDIKVST